MTDRAKELLQQLTKQYNYSESSLLLFRQLTDFLTTIVQDDICLRKKSHENRLHDLLCEFSMAYVPVPVEAEWIQHGKLVNGKKMIGEGSNGRIYKSGTFAGNPMVTKTKKKWSNHTVFDIYINFVILNSILLSGKLTDNLIPSYGMFLCNINEDGTEICVKPSKQQHIFLVQKEVKGKTLASYLKTMPLDSFKQITHELFSILIHMESTSYKLYHTDLHCGNIMIADDDESKHPILLDFELCSFSVSDENGKPHRYRLNSLENKYCNKDHVLSGAHDAILYFAHASAFENASLRAYCLETFRKIGSYYWTDVDTPMVLSMNSIRKSTDRWLFQMLMDAEDKLPNDKKKIVHEHNIKQLRTMTYQWIMDTIGL